MTKSNAGFSLLELILVITILGVLSVSAISRFADDDSFRVRVIQEDLISALTQAQQLAMAGQAVQFIITSGTPQTYSVQVGSPLVDYSVAGIEYPQEINASISLTPSALTLSYDSLGRPDATATLVLTADSGDTDSICVVATGLAYDC